MKNDAPHLPPKSCDVKLHDRLLTMPALLLVVCISVLAGVAASLAAIAWIAPPLSIDYALSFSDNNRILGGSSMDPTTSNGLRQKMISIFDITKKTNKVIYPESAFVAHAAILSSDGWSVIENGQYRQGREKQWEGIDSQGVAHSVERAVADPVAGVVYLKFKGDGFRVFSFPDWRSVDTDVVFWRMDMLRPMSQNGGWKRVSVGDSVKTQNDFAYPVWRVEYQYRLEPSLSEGSILVNDRGEFAGFSDKKSFLIPGWFVAAQLPSILSSGKISYDSILWEGYMADGRLMASEGSKLLSGFYVSKTGLREFVQRGDMITRIGGEPIEPAILSRQVLFAPESFFITVIRNGEEKDILIGKK